MTLPANVVDLTEFSSSRRPYRVAVVNTDTAWMLPISATTLGAYTDRDAITVRADLPPG
jgi:hypothetical protein